MGSTRGRGQGGGLAHIVRSKISSWYATVEETRLPWGNQEDNRTSPTWHQEPIMHGVRNIVNEWPLFCMYIVAMTNVNMAWHLTIDYLFQENKSYGSKKPFAASGTGVISLPYPTIPTGTGHTLDMCSTSQLILPHYVLHVAIKYFKI